MLRLVLAPHASSPPSALERHALIGDPEGTPTIFGSRLGNDYWVWVPDCACFHFRLGSGDVTAYPEPRAEHRSILDAYYTDALPIAVHVVLGAEAVHASANVVSEGIVAFCGMSHAGKTTLAYGLSRRGHPIWADDIVAFESSRGEEPVSIRLPFEVGLRTPSAAFFDAQPDGASGDHRIFEEWERVPLAAVFVLEPAGRPPRKGHLIRRHPPREAFLAVLEHSFLFRPQTLGEKRRMMGNYLEMIAHAPVFGLHLERGFETLPAALDEIEETVRQNAGPKA
jgi:hypothetical protein